MRGEIGRGRCRSTPDGWLGSFGTSERKDMETIPQTAAVVGVPTTVSRNEAFWRDEDETELGRCVVHWGRP